MRNPIAVTLALALASCGSSEKGESAEEHGAQPGTYVVENGETRASITAKDGSVTSLRAGENVPVKLPRDFTIAPGLTVLSNAHVERDGATFVLLSMQGDTPVEEVIAFYRQQAEAAGVEVNVAIKSKESTTIAGESEDGLAFSTIATRTDDTTSVQLTVNQGIK